MTYGFLGVSMAYALFVVALIVFERKRTRSSGTDPITVFLALFLLQCGLSNIVLYALLPFADPIAPTGTEVLDHILQSIDVPTALAVLCMAIWFAIFFYIGCALAQLALSRSPWTMTRVPRFHVAVLDTRLLTLLTLGLTVTLWSFYLMGDSLVARYTNLILLRADSESVERNAFNSNALALTQTWGWLALVALFAVRERRGRGPRWLACVVMIAIFAILGVSRRALFLPFLLGYLTLVLYDGRWRTLWVLVGCIPLLLLVAFGKEALSTVGWGGSVEGVTGTYQSAISAVLRPVSDVGITNVESLGTLTFLHVPMRFGIDHLLSIAQRFPEGVLGIDLHFPERIVRVSTEAFADANNQDLPPGIFGQMWLDFGVLGPLVWGLLFGLQLGIVAFFWRRTVRSKQSAAVFVLLTFVLALPLNTGSFDFTFSVDIFALLLILMWCMRIRGEPYPEAS